MEDNFINGLPAYRSHKVVKAAKIMAIDFDARLDLAPHGVIEVGKDWIRAKQARVGGYFVVYEDGYASFSPAKAFEDGYTLAQNNPAATGPTERTPYSVNDASVPGEPPTGGA